MNARLRAALARRDDAGMTLVEVLVSSMLAIFLLALIAGLFIRSMEANAAVRATTAATNDARVQFDAIQQAVRLGVETDVRVGTAPTVAVANGQGDLLIVKTRRNEGVVGASSTWRCMGWYLAPDHTLRAVSAITPAVGSTPVTATNPSSWPVVASDVKALSPQPAFLAHDPDADVEAWYPGSLTVALEFDPPDGSVSVNVSSTVAPRRQLQLDGEIPGGAKCTAT